MNKAIGLVIISMFVFCSANSQEQRISKPSGKNFINRLDRNSDGRVSSSEFDGPRHHFQVLDENNDGYLSADEAPQGPPGRMNRRKMNRQNKRGQQSSNKQLMDVHGAGAQRSDPKSGNPRRYSNGHGPQGDVVRIYNFARCTRNGQSTNARSYKVVDTGQNSCYDNGKEGVLNSCPEKGQYYHGQDAYYQGIKPNYRDNKNGTISDNNTGLMWQKSFSKAQWDKGPSLAKSARTGGFSDWRVPTIKELYSLMNFSGTTGMAGPGSSSVPKNAIPYINKNYFDFEYATTGRYIDAQYITNTAYVSTVMGGQKAFFGVNFADGRIKGYPQKDRRNRYWYARYVRGNPNYGKNSFKDNNDETITDYATGLIWMKMDSGDKSFERKLSRYEKNDGSLNWNEALDFCEQLNFAGNDDWRLPNAKELHTILDYSRSPDTTNSAVIDPIFKITSIKNEAGKNDFPFFWSSTTHLDGKNPGQWAVYVSFGKALGFMGNKTQLKRRTRMKNSRP